MFAEYPLTETIAVFRVVDNDDHRGVEDSPPPATGAGGASHRPVLGVRLGRAAPSHGLLHSGRALARLHLLCNRLRGASHPGCAYRLARPPGRDTKYAVPAERHDQWTGHQVQVCDGALLHLHQPHEHRLRQRRAQHERRESLLNLRYDAWL